jgi:hypothetical protein
MHLALNCTSHTVVHRILTTEREVHEAKIADAKARREGQGQGGHGARGAEAAAAAGGADETGASPFALALALAGEAAEDEIGSHA